MYVIFESLVEPLLRHFNIFLVRFLSSYPINLSLKKRKIHATRSSRSQAFWSYLCFRVSKFMKCIVSSFIGVFYFCFWRCGTHWQPTNAWRRWKDTVELCWLCVHTSKSVLESAKILFLYIFAFREPCKWLTEQTYRALTNQTDVTFQTSQM